MRTVTELRAVGALNTIPQTEQPTVQLEQPEPVKAEPLFSGPAVAATLAPLFGFFTLMISHHVSRLSSELDRLVHSYGYWIPGSVGSGPDGSIGSYAGKEALALLVWGLSWVVLHLLWRRQELSIGRWIPVFLGALALVTLGFFHPIIDPVVLWLASVWG